MDVSQTQGSAGATTVSRQNANTSPSALSSDFETFLKMLTVQMQNQDPLNPVDSSDFAVQLATFSTVEQQVRTNDILSSLGDRLTGFDMGQLSGWIGMTARAEMPVAFAGDPVTLTLNPSTGADLARLVVRNERGAIVQQLDAPVTGGDFTWTGVGEGGTVVPYGTYSIELDSFQGETLLSTRQAESQARVVEAKRDGDSTILVLDGGQEISADTVIGLRETPEN